MLCGRLPTQIGEFHVEPLLRRGVVQNFPTLAVDQEDRVIEPVSIEIDEVAVFGIVASKQAVGVFIRTALVGAIGFGEERVATQSFLDLHVRGEFAAIVERDRPDAVFHWRQLPDDGRGHLDLRFVPQRTTYQKASLAFHQGQNGTFVVLADHRVGFPVSELLARLHMRGSFVDILALGNERNARRFSFSTMTRLVLAQ